MADRNERKAMVLALVIRQGSVTSRDLVERWAVTPYNASMLLVKYQRQGLLHRDREPGPGPPVYRYSLTKSGYGRAVWMAMRGELQALGQRHLPGLEPEELRIRPVLREESVQRVRPQLRD